MRDEPEIMHPIFTESNCFKWNVEDFLQNLEVKFADEGSNKFVKEVDNFKYFSDSVEQMSVRGTVFLNISHNRPTLLFLPEVRF